MYSDDGHVDGLTLGRKANRWKIGELAAPMQRKANEQKCRPEDGKVVYVFDNDDKKVVEGRVTARMENSEKGRAARLSRWEVAFACYSDKWEHWDYNWGDLFKEKEECARAYRRFN